MYYYNTKQLNNGHVLCLGIIRKIMAENKKCKVCIFFSLFRDGLVNGQYAQIPKDLTVKICFWNYFLQNK